MFEGIRERVADGRWVPVGGMWVEADTNLAGGEALLRQFTHGQRFFREHFGVTCTETWIPDVFGYPGSLPGIMAHAGIERFLTQKLSWNQTKPLPAPDVLVGGHRWVDRLHALPAGRDLQRHVRRTRAGPRRAHVRRAGPCQSESDAVRLGGRWRGPSPT